MFKTFLFNKKAQLIFFGISLFLPLLGTADDVPPRELKPLLDQHERPTVSQLQTVIQKNPEVATFLHDPSLVEKYTQSLTEQVAPTLALSERLFPDATFFVMGRDAVIMGDALEAIFLKLGETERVHRVDLSGPSFASEPRVLQRYLKQIGLNPFELLKKKKNAIVLDRSTYRTVSQSFLTMELLYRLAEDKGYLARDLRKRVIFFGLQAQYNGAHIDSGKTLEQKMAEIAESGTRASRAGYYGTPQKALQVPGLTDSTPWHDSWGTLRTKPGSREVLTSPGFSLPENHLLVLKELAALLKATEDPNFWAELIAQKRKQGLKPGNELERATRGKDLETLKALKAEALAVEILKNPTKNLEAIQQRLNMVQSQLVYNWSWGEDAKTFVTLHGVLLPGYAKTNREFSDFFYNKYLPEVVNLIGQLLTRATSDRTYRYNQEAHYVNLIHGLLEPIIPTEFIKARPSLQVLKNQAQSSFILSELMNGRTLYKPLNKQMKTPFAFVPKKRSMVHVLRRFSGI